MFFLCRVEALKAKYTVIDSIGADEDDGLAAMVDRLDNGTLMYATYKSLVVFVQKIRPTFGYVEHQFKKLTNCDEYYNKRTCTAPTSLEIKARAHQYRKRLINLRDNQHSGCQQID